LTQEDILKHLITLKDNKNLAFLGYKQGENYKTYAEYTVDRANELIINLSHLIDYLIIDASSFLHLDLLTKSSLKLADEVIRLCGSDLKGISYFKSTLPLLTDKSFNLNSHINLLSKLEDNEPKSIITNHYGNIFCDLPYTEEINNQWREGLLMDSLSEKNSIKYNESLNKMIVKITGEIENIKDIKKVRRKRNKSDKPAKKPKLSFKLPIFKKKKEQDDYE
jgi:MinD-like ATPase involved in chromosome partitioning or flagellar assembly